MSDTDAQSVTQEAREAAHELMQKVRGYAVKMPDDRHFAIQAFARFQHRLSTQPSVDALAWMYEKGDRTCIWRDRAEPGEMCHGNGWTETALGPIASRPSGDAQGLREALEWYRDQMCEGFCEGFTPRICEAAMKENPTGGDCAGCRAVVALSSIPSTKGDEA